MCQSFDGEFGCFFGTGSTRSFMAKLHACLAVIPRFRVYPLEQSSFLLLSAAVVLPASNPIAILSEWLLSRLPKAPAFMRQLFVCVCVFFLTLPINLHNISLNDVILTSTTAHKGLGLQGSGSHRRLTQRMG